jgi:hypothetical protein
VETKEQARRGELIDEAGRIGEEIGDKAKRLKDLEKQFRLWTEADGVDAGAAVLYVGAIFAVTVAKKEEQRRILSLRAIYKKVGITKFLDKCSLTLKALEDLVGKDHAEQYVARERTGSRDVTIARTPTPQK